MPVVTEEVHPQLLSDFAIAAKLNKKVWTPAERKKYLPYARAKKDELMQLEKITQQYFPLLYVNIM